MGVDRHRSRYPVPTLGWSVPAREARLSGHVRSAALLQDTAGLRRFPDSAEPKRRTWRSARSSELIGQIGVDLEL